MEQSSPIHYRPNGNPKGPWKIIAGFFAGLVLILGIVGVIRSFGDDSSPLNSSNQSNQNDQSVPIRESEDSTESSITDPTESISSNELIEQSSDEQTDSTDTNDPDFTALYSGAVFRIVNFEEVPLYGIHADALGDEADEYSFYSYEIEVDNSGGGDLISFNSFNTYIEDENGVRPDDVTTLFSGLFFDTENVKTRDALAPGSKITEKVTVRTEKGLQDPVLFLAVTSSGATAPTSFDDLYDYVLLSK